MPDAPSPTPPRPGLLLGPRAEERAGAPGWTLVGVLDGRHPAVVDQGGLVSPGGAGWSLDWWIGAEDRWYLPAREPTTRQRRLGVGPVVETLVRIPGGDARHLVYGVLVGGWEATVVEVHNESPVPVALALAVRPYPVGRRGGSPPGEVVPADRMVIIDAEPALVLPRPPNQTGVAIGHDLLVDVEAGRDLAWDPTLSRGADQAAGDEAAGDDAAGDEAANAVLVYPLPHRTSLRVVLLGGRREGLASDAGPSATGASPARRGEEDGDLVGDRIEAVLAPDRMPDAETVVRGWASVVEAGARFGFPDDGITGLVGAARARLLLAAPDLASAACGLAPGSGEVVEALALGGHLHELRPLLEAVAAGFPTRLDDGPRPAAAVIAGAAAALVALDQAPPPNLVEWGLQVTHLVERSGDLEAIATAHRGLAALAEAAGDIEGATDLSRRLPPPTQPDLAMVTELAEQATAAGSWHAIPDRSEQGGGDDPVSAARFVLAARSLLIDDRGTDLVLLPRFPSGWRGGDVEVHRAPTRFGRISFGVRWHGPRPAMLWQFDPRSQPGGARTGLGGARTGLGGARTGLGGARTGLGGARTGLGGARTGPTIRCPGLDPDWSTTTARGEVLLAGSGSGLPAVAAEGESFS